MYNLTVYTAAIHPTRLCADFGRLNGSPDFRQRHSLRLFMDLLGPTFYDQRWRVAFSVLLLAGVSHLFFLSSTLFWTCSSTFAGSVAFLWALTLTINILLAAISW